MFIKVWLYEAFLLPCGCDSSSSIFTQGVLQVLPQMRIPALLCPSLREAPDYARTASSMVNLVLLVTIVPIDLCFLGLGSPSRYLYVRLDGTMSIKKRAKVVERFNSPSVSTAVQ